MKIQTLHRLRLGSALIATMLVTPLGAGVASAAAVEPDPTVAVTASDEAGASEVTASETAPVESEAAPATESDDAGSASDDPTEVTEPAGEATADDAPADPSTGDVTSTEDPAAEATVPTGATAPTGTTTPRAAAIPEGVLITSLAVDATVSPVQQPWNTRGAYAATLTVHDVVGTGSDTLSYAGLVADSAFTLSVNGGTPTAVQPATDGTVPVTGIVEGTNYLVLNVQYANPEAPAVTAAASYYVELRVLTQAETVDLVREDTASTGVNEGTRYQGEQVTVVAPAGTYTPGEVLTVTVYDENDVAVDTVTAVAAADGSLSVTYSVPPTMTPGDYLLYLSDAAGQPAGSYILHVLERVAEPVTPVDNTVTATDTTQQVKTDPAVSTVRSAALADRLATTGSDSSAALWAAGGLAAAGAVLAGGAAMLRRRRSVDS
ncbi:hypothetical protein [Cellulomonas taurus]|uniref:hypothetical protein n=1 Tax=Cellulomonas taurus TaxID=2729175 RepID=UPI00145C40AB|nr:hypothetical protein [Cellulomonas taurus]